MFDQNVLDNIEVIAHSGIRISGEKVIYIDPILVKTEPHDADIILFTHPHTDHFSPKDVKKLLKNTTVIAAPKSMELLCKIRLGREIQPLLPAENYTINGIQVETVAAYNNSKPPHFKILKWLGYILTIGDTKVYISGDTDITNESKNVSCDIAILPIGGTYTVDPKQAAELAKAIAPHTVIPVHYGKLLGGEDAPEKFISAISDDIKVDVRPTVYSDILISMYTKTAILTGTAIILLLIIEKML